MQDLGHSQTDKILAKTIRRVNQEYSQAAKELRQKYEEYLLKFETKNKIKLEKLTKGEITKEEYTQWRTGQIMMSKRWVEMCDSLAQDLSNTNRIAASIVNGYTPEVYALNHNYGTYEVEKGALVDTSYTLYDRQTVERLIAKNPDLLPKASVDIPKDLKWNKQKITSAVTQGILQGEGIRDMSKRLMNVSDMNRKQAVRNARTMTTSAENVGRLDSYVRVKNMGINMAQVWVATLDGRTRDSHRALDGEQIKVGDKWHTYKFSNGCRYPGDPQGPPREVYNCRCTLIAQVEGVNWDLADTSLRNNYKLGSMSYQDWKASHEQKQRIEETEFAGIRASLGDDYVNTMLTMLNFTEETDVKDLFYKYGDRLKVVESDINQGAWFSATDGGIHINAKMVQNGDNAHLPYQTIFHEFGHNIDWLSKGGIGWGTNSYSSTSYRNGEGKTLSDTIKQDWVNFKWQYLTDDYNYDPYSDNTVYIAIEQIFGERGQTLIRQQKENNTSILDMLNSLTNSEKNQFMDKWGFRDSTIIDKLKKENLSYSARASISDIIEGCTDIKYPLGVGHGINYHHKQGATAREFFAEVVDGKAANPKSLEQMRRIFPNGVKMVEEIIKEISK